MKKNVPSIINNSLSEALSLNPVMGQELVSSSPLLDPYILSGDVSYQLLTMLPYTLSYAYKQYGFLRTAIDQPVEDAFARGVGLESETLSVDELEQLKQAMEDNEDWEAIKDAYKWGFLFGGGVLIADTDQKTDKPLNKPALEGRRLEFIASDRWETTMIDPVAGAQESDFLFHETVINRSRTSLALGMNAPYYVRLRLQGWGLSFFEQCLPPIVQYLKSQGVMLELLDEAKIDVLKINQLSTTLMSNGGTSLIKKRVDIAAQNKNYKSMLVMDSQDDYQQKQLQMSGLADFNREIRIMVCAYLKIPECKVWGIGANGFSSGQDMLENYNTRIDSEIRPKMEKMIKWVVDLRCWQLFGREVPDLTIKWSPLRVLTGLDEQNQISQTFNNVFGMVDRGLMKPSEAMEFLKMKDIVTMNTAALDGEADEEYIAKTELIQDRSGNEE
jgi:phage-related protein (TIGR01555 family)